MSAVKPSKSLHLSRFRAPKIYFPDLVSFAVLGFLISGVRKLLTWATFWISDFEEGGAAELGGGALVVGSVGTASRHCTLSAGEVSRLEGPCRSGLTGVACSSGKHSSQVIPQPGAGFDSFLGRKTLAWSKCPRYTPKLSRALSA